MQLELFHGLQKKVIMHMHVSGIIIIMKKISPQTINTKLNPLYNNFKNIIWQKDGITRLVYMCISKHMQGSCPKLVDETTEEIIATGADDVNDKLKSVNKYHRTVRMCVNIIIMHL